MSWRTTVNAGLSKATGYTIVKTERLRPPPRPRRKRRLPRHYDDEAREIIRAVRPRTMTSHEKLFALIVATRHVVDQNVAGAIVECGVWRGGSMQAVARTLLGRGVSDRDLHLYDTFEGMPPPTDADRRHDGRPAAELLETTPRTGKVWAVAGLEDVQAGMAETGYPPERIHFHAGLVEETIPAGAPERIALLRLDTDWYESTKHELTHLYQRLAPGGVLIIDDYGTWQGSRDATDEFLTETGEPLLLVRTGWGRAAVKPGLTSRVG
jgi:O-methyltransferase